MSDPEMPNADTAKSQVQAVIAAFGGLSSTARALGHQHASTVHGWLRAGRIPPWRWREIKDAAEKLGIALPDNVLGSTTSVSELANDDSREQCANFSVLPD